MAQETCSQDIWTSGNTTRCHQYRPGEPLSVLEVHSWCKFYGFWQVPKWHVSTDYFHCPKSFCALFVSPPLPCKPWATSDLASLCSFAFPKTSYSWNHIHSLCPLCSIGRSVFFLMVHCVPYLFWHKFLVVIYTVNLFLCISWLLLCSKPPQNVVAYKHHHVDDTRDWLFGLGLAGEVCLCSMWC